MKDGATYLSRWLGWALICSTVSFAEDLKASPTEDSCGRSIRPEASQLRTYRKSTLLLQQSRLCVPSFRGKIYRKERQFHFRKRRQKRSRRSRKNYRIVPTQLSRAGRKCGGGPSGNNDLVQFEIIGHHSGRRIAAGTRNALDVAIFMNSAVSFTLSGNFVKSSRLSPSQTSTNRPI